MRNETSEIITFEEAYVMDLSDTNINPKQEIRVEPDGRAQQLLKLVISISAICAAA